MPSRADSTGQAAKDGACLVLGVHTARISAIRRVVSIAIELDAEAEQAPAFS